MYVRKLNKHRVVYGAEWAAMPGAEDLVKEIRSTAKQLQAKLFVKIDRDGLRPLVGFTQNHKGARGAYSVAALLPQLVPNLNAAIFSFALEQDLYAVIGIVDGLPMIGYDCVGTFEAMQSRIAQYFDEIDCAPGEVALYGEADLFVDRRHDVEPFGIDLAAIDKTKLELTRFGLVAPPYALLLSGAAIVALSLGGWYGYEQYQLEQRKKIMQTQVDPNVLYEANASRMLSQAGYSTRETLKGIYQQAGKTPMYVGGWQLASVVCQPPDSCQTQWEGTHMPGVTLEGFMQEKPAGWIVSFKSDFQTITAAHTVEKAPEARQGLVLQDIPRADDFTIKVGSLLQALKPIGVMMQLQPPTIFALPPVPQGQPPITEAVLRNPVKEGHWKATLPAWTVESLYDLPRNMMITSMTIHSGAKDVLLTVEGKYYVGK